MKTAAPRKGGTKVTPCDPCRKYKSRCCKQGPDQPCLLCSLHGRACTYNTVPTRRTNVRSPPAAAGSSTTASSSDGRDSSQQESLLTGTLGLQPRHHSRLIGRNSFPDAYHYFGDPLLSVTPPDLQGIKRTRVRYVDSHSAFQLIPDSGTESYSEEQLLHHEVEACVGDSGRLLVDLYMRMIHPSFPALEPSIFLDQYNRAPDEITVALKAAVYLLACVYWRFDPMLEARPMPNLLRLRDLAFHALRLSFLRPKLSTVQSALLLSQYQAAGQPDMADAGHSRLGILLVDLAHQLGLHLDPGSFTIPPWEKGLRRRLSSFIFQQDKWRALFDGTPQLIARLDFDVMPIQPSDLPDFASSGTASPYEFSSGFASFIALDRLAVILSDALTDVFSVRVQRLANSGTGQLQDMLSRSHAIFVALDEWKESLPAYFAHTADHMSFKTNCMLEMSLLTIQVCIHRQVFNIVRSQPRPESALIASCCDHALQTFMQASRFVQELRPQDLALLRLVTCDQALALMLSLGKVLLQSSYCSDRHAQVDEAFRAMQWSMRIFAESGTVAMASALQKMAQPVEFV